jgi:hypothetical protein
MSFEDWLAVGTIVIVAGVVVAFSFFVNRREDTSE